jgi:RHS repeat-associated protein
VVSAQGKPLGQLDYGPYGEQEKARGRLTDFRYAGMLYHPNSGYYFTHYRVYDPETGRWLSRDPIGENGGLNLYGYVGGNPVSSTDPLGLSPNGSSGGAGSGGSQGQQCDGDNCKQTFLDCVAQCIRAYDPLNDGSKIGLTAAGGTFPKSWVGLPRGLGGASPMTTVPSAAAHALGGGGAGTLGGAARGLGRMASPMWIGYGVYLFGMEAYCATSCANNNCAY